VFLNKKKGQNKNKAFKTLASFRPNESVILKMLEWVDLETQRKVHKTKERYSSKHSHSLISVAVLFNDLHMLIKEATSLSTF